MNTTKNKSNIEVTEDMYCDIGIYDYYKEPDYQNYHLSYQLNNDDKWRYNVSIYSKQQALNITHYLESGYSVIRINGGLYNYLSLFIEKKLGLIEIDKHGRIIDFAKVVYLKAAGKQVNSFKYNSSTINYYAIKLPNRRSLERQLESAQMTTNVYLIKSDLLEQMKFIYNTLSLTKSFNWSSLYKENLLPDSITINRDSTNLFIRKDLLYSLLRENYKTEQEIVDYINCVIETKKNENILKRL